MEDEKNAILKELNAQQPSNIIISNGEKEIVKIVCDVCGYANDKYTAVCKMCSNYLK